MCIEIYDHYLDCEKDHNIETYHRCLAGHQYVLDINNDGCKKSRSIYCLITGPCPKCEFGSDCFDSENGDPMDIDDDVASDESSNQGSEAGSDEEGWETSSVTDAESSKSDLGEEEWPGAEEWPVGF
jgi:hypothetical protein